MTQCRIEVIEAINRPWGAWLGRALQNPCCCLWIVKVIGSALYLRVRHVAIPEGREGYLRDVVMIVASKHLGTRTQPSSISNSGDEVLAFQERLLEQVQLPLVLECLLSNSNERASHGRALDSDIDNACSRSFREGFGDEHPWMTL